MRFVAALLLVFVLTGCDDNGNTPIKVQLTSLSDEVQEVGIGQENITFYEIKNSDGSGVPIEPVLDAAGLSVFEAETTCGDVLKGNDTCTLAVLYRAPAQSQHVVAAIKVMVGWNRFVQAGVTYNVTEHACRLLPKESYQSAFCQTQYQHFFHESSGVVNDRDVNVIEGQTLGASIGVYRKSGENESICYIGCGKSSKTGGLPDELTMFELASVTKTFTGSILGKKVYLGEVTPGASVNPYLPAGSWEGVSYNLTPAEQAATFGQLATFSGGVCFSSPKDVNTSRDFQTQQSKFIEAVNLLDPSLAPWCPGGDNPSYKPVYAGDALPTKNIYSNSSFGLLGQAMMAMDGYQNMDEADFNGWMCQHVLTPLHMTYTNSCTPTQIANNECIPTGPYCDTSKWGEATYATGYHVTPEHNYSEGEPFPFVPWAPAGALRSNVSDMVKYLRSNLNAVEPSSQEIKELEAGMSLAHRAHDYEPAPGEPQPNIGSQFPLKGGQGYAWVCELFPDSNDTICGKIGGHNNFWSFAGFSQAKQYGIVVLFNTGKSVLPEEETMAPLPSPSVIGTQMIKAAR